MLPQACVADTREPHMIRCVLATRRRPTCIAQRPQVLHKQRQLRDCGFFSFPYGIGFDVQLNGNDGWEARRVDRPAPQGSPLGACMHNAARGNTVRVEA